MEEIYRVQELEQLQLLSDPLKLRLIQSFAEGPRTVGQVADELGENVTRLYRHVDALFDAGLLEIIREVKKRGTIERTFCAVARRFEVDRALLTDSPESEEPIRQLLRSGEDEVLRALAEPVDDDEPLLMRLRIRGTRQQLAELREVLERWVKQAQEADDGEPGDGADVQTAGALIAFYRLADSGPKEDDTT